MIQIKSQIITQVNCIQTFISKLLNKISKLNSSSLDKKKLRKLLLKFIDKYPIVIQNSFSFLIKINLTNIFVQWNLDEKIFNIEILSISESTNIIDNFIQNYIQSDLVNVDDFNKLSILIGNINFTNSNSLGKIINKIIELKNISLNTNKYETNFNFSFSNTSIKTSGYSGPGGQGGTGGLVGTTVQISVNETII